MTDLQPMQKSNRFIMDVVDTAAADLMRVGSALDQLRQDNQVLSDALTDAQKRVLQLRRAELLAKKRVTTTKGQVTRVEATVARRDATIAELEIDMDKLRSEHADREASLAAQSDESAENGRMLMAGARREIADLRDLLASLEDELANERQRVAPDVHNVQLMTQAGTTLVVNGEAIGAVAWPELAEGDRRPRVIEAADRFHRRHEVAIELVFGSTEGWDSDWFRERPGGGLRLRVPYEEIPLDSAIRRLATSYAAEGGAVTVSHTPSQEPWVNAERAASLMGLPVPPRSHQSSEVHLSTELAKAGDQ